MHGKFSKRFAREEQATQALIDAALQDPDLLDHRRPAALATALIQSVQLIPDQDTLVELARQAIPWKVQAEHLKKNDEPIEPTAAQIEVVRRRYIESSMFATERYSRTVAAAAKQAQLGQLVSAELIPLFEELAIMLQRLTKRYVDEDKRDDFLEGFRRGFRHVIMQAAMIGDD